MNKLVSRTCVLRRGSRVTGLVAAAAGSLRPDDAADQRSAAAAQPAHRRARAPAQPPRSTPREEHGMLAGLLVADRQLRHPRRRPLVVPQAAASANYLRRSAQLDPQGSGRSRERQERGRRAARRDRPQAAGAARRDRRAAKRAARKRSPPRSSASPALAAAERDRLLEQTRREIELQVRLAKRELVEHAADLSVQLADRAHPEDRSRRPIRSGWSIAISIRSKTTPATRRTEMSCAHLRHSLRHARCSTSRSRNRIRRRSSSDLASIRRRRSTSHAELRARADQPRRPADGAASDSSRGRRHKRARQPPLAKLLALLADRGRARAAAAICSRSTASGCSRTGTSSAARSPSAAPLAPEQGAGARAEPVGARPASRCSSTSPSIRRSSAASSRGSAARCTTAASGRSLQRMKQQLVENAQ